MKKYTFSIKLSASIEVEAATAAEALEMLKASSGTMDCNGGAWPDGSPILFEASLIERPDLKMAGDKRCNVVTLLDWHEFNAMEAKNNG